MIFRIHNEDSTDEIVIEGKTIEEIREKLNAVIVRRPDFNNGWSEEL